MENQQPKNLQAIQKERLQNKTSVPPTVTPTPTPPATYSEPPTEGLSPQLPPNHILNVIKTLQKKQERDTVWFEFNLPSNGKCGYPREIAIREMTTLDEKVLIKEMFSSKENSILNVIRKCARFDSMPDFDFENLTTFDQDYILVELSAITFPGEKDITVTDDNGHKVKTKLNKEDLSLSVVPENTIYPFKVSLPELGIDWYLSFMTLKKLKEIDRALKSMSTDVLNRLLISIAFTTEKVELNGQNIVFDNFYEIVKLLDTLSPAQLKTVIDFYNEKTGTAYGYKLTKEYYCAECGKGGHMELEPLSFFRIAI